MIPKRLFWVLMAFLIALSVGSLAAAAVGTGAVSFGKPDWQKNDELTSDTIARTLERAVPYPISQMKDSLERRNLRDRLLTFNNPNKIGYVYLMSFGKFVGYYVIKGKITSTQSQMTTTLQTWDCGGANGACSVPSIGDDGSFGPNEGGDKGVFFSTAQGVFVETTLDWVYSDKPLSVDVPNLIKHK